MPKIWTQTLQSGSENLTFRIPKEATSVTLIQDNKTGSGSCADITIQAQSSATAANGGDIFIVAGTGATNQGGIQLYPGGGGDPSIVINGDGSVAIGPGGGAVQIDLNAEVAGSAGADTGNYLVIHIGGVPFKLKLYANS